MVGAAEKEEEYWVNRLQRFDIGPGEFRKLQGECREETEPGVSLHDTVWWILNRLVGETGKELAKEDWWYSALRCVDTLRSIYLEMVWLASMEGKDPTQHLVNTDRAVSVAVRSLEGRMDVPDLQDMLEGELQNNAVGVDMMARDMEREGMIKQASALYEFNIKDGGVYPFYYDRLRILYSRQRRYGEAVRVCRAFVDEAKREGGADPKAVKKFSDWIPKLEAKQRKRAAGR